LRLSWDLDRDVQWRHAARRAIGVDHRDHALHLAGGLLDGLLAARYGGIEAGLDPVARGDGVAFVSASLGSALAWLL
jgi:hypothetical protein